MKRFMYLLSLVCILGLRANADDVEFNYNGFVRVENSPYDGTGQFKFAIVDEAGGLTYWASDGATLNGDEPTASVSIPVSSGRFSVDVGDTNLTGMAALDPTVFNGEDGVYLRVWFSDGVHGFQALLPNRKIVNPRLLGLTSESEIDLYVNPSTGFDHNAGTRSSKPLKTINKAWKTLPSLIKANVRIHLADGIYRESVFLNSKTVVGDVTIRIIGDTAAPADVRVTGALAGAESTPIKEKGFVIQSQKRLSIEGVLFNEYKIAGVDLEDESGVEFLNCKFLHNRYGILTFRSTLVADTCEFGNGYEGNGLSIGLHMNRFSGAQVKNCSFHNLFIGATAQQLSLLESITGTTSSNNTVAYQITQGSNMMFGAPNSTISNNTTAIIGGQNSSITYSATYVTYSGNTTQYDLRTGTVLSE